jgi:1-acyl-sn-glycerol-3-phosphate acyltransferase
VPAFVPRQRYARFVPLVSGCIRLLGCPIVDPKRDPKGAVKAIGEAAARLPYGMLIFPEGHRSRDGELLPWRSSGLLAALRARRMPVYLVVGDGLWRTRRLVDFLVHLPRVRGRAEVIGPFSPPEDVDELPAFLDELRERMAAHLAEMRRT